MLCNLGKPKFEASDVVITCIVQVCDQSTSVLFDLRSTLFYVSTYYDVGFDMMCDRMLVPIHVSTLICVFLSGGSSALMLTCLFRGYDTWLDLIILGMVDFDVLLGVDCLYYHDIFHCNAKFA